MFLSKAKALFILLLSIYENESASTNPFFKSLNFLIIFNALIKSK